MEEIKEIEKTTSISVSNVPVKVIDFLKEQNFKIAGICRDALIKKYEEIIKNKQKGGKPT